MWARRQGQRAVAAGTDAVIGGISLPSDTVIHDIRAKVHLNVATAENEMIEILGYALEMYILPALDVDAGTSFQTVWDNLVPKDTDVQAIDLDTAAADATPFWEPGEADWSKVLDVGLRPEKVWGHQEWVTSSSPMSTVLRDPATPFETQWAARDLVNVHVSRKLRVRQPSVLVLALASPSLDDTTTSEEGFLNENEWSRVKYASDMLKQAHMDLIGLTEAGATTPWEEATDLLQRHLQPDVFEQTADVFKSVTWQNFLEMTVDHSVVGELGMAQLSLS